MSQTGTPADKCRTLSNRLSLRIPNRDRGTSPDDYHGRVVAGPVSRLEDVESDETLPRAVDAPNARPPTFLAKNCRA